MNVSNGFDRRHPSLGYFLWRGLGMFSIALLLFLLALVCIFALTGCAYAKAFHADSRRVATCDVTDRNQIEALDERTGFPLFSTPHRYSCRLDENKQVVWIVEQESTSSLEVFSDLPSAIIQRGIPTSTVGY